MIAVACSAAVPVAVLSALTSPFAAAPMSWKWAARLSAMLELRSQPVDGTEIEVVLR